MECWGRNEVKREAYKRGASRRSMCQLGEEWVGSTERMIRRGPR